MEYVVSYAKTKTCPFMSGAYSPSDGAVEVSCVANGCMAWVTTQEMRYDRRWVKREMLTFDENFLPQEVIEIEGTQYVIDFESDFWKGDSLKEAHTFYYNASIPLPINMHLGYCSLLKK